MPDKSLADGSQDDAPVLHYHDYGKAARPLRKVGHLTLTAESTAALAALWPRVPAALRQRFASLDEFFAQMTAVAGAPGHD